MMMAQLIFISHLNRSGMENNSVSTAKGGKWLPMFRLYGPDKEFFEKAWKMGDVEEVK